MLKEYFEIATIVDVKYHSVDDLEPEVKMIVKNHELICFFPGSAVFQLGRKYNVKLTLDTPRFVKISNKDKKIYKCDATGFADYSFKGEIIDICRDPYGYFLIMDCGVIIEISIGEACNLKIGDYISTEGELILDDYQLL